MEMQKIRREQRYSIAELAKCTGLSWPTIAKIERGEIASVTFGTVGRIARQLGVSIVELCGETLNDI